MGRFSTRVTFGVIVNDTQHWDSESLTQAEDASDYDDWATDQISATMRAAAEAWMTAHPGVIDQIV